MAMVYQRFDLDVVRLDKLNIPEARELGLLGDLEETVRTLQEEQTAQGRTFIPSHETLLGAPRSILVGSSSETISREALLGSKSPIALFYVPIHSYTFNDGSAMH